MKKFMKTTLVLLLGSTFAFATACGGGGSDSSSSSVGETTSSDVTSGSGSSESHSTSGGGQGGVSATIKFYTSVNIIEYKALTAAANAYSDLQYDKGNDITILIDNKTDPEAYTQNVRNMASQGVSAPTIVGTSIIPEYYGTDRIVDLTGYIEEENPYMGGTVWMDGLEEDAYRTQVVGSTATVPGLSYSSNYLTVFYNKHAVLDVLGASDPAVSEDGTIDQSKVTWTWLINALDKAKNSGKNFANPLGLSSSVQSCNEGSFNMLSHLVNMYLDQYFRDFIGKVHSEEGDYSYIGGIDSAWTYDPSDAGIDSADRYTFNLNKVVDLYFNQQGYNPESERYAEVMENLYDLMRYADKEAAYGDVFNRFNETTIVYEKKGGSYSDMKLFYVEALDYVRTYRDAFKTTTGNKTVYPSASQISSELGWFLMPAMESDLPGVADNVRAFGGPAESYGIINSGNEATNDIAADFLMYLLSPAGQAGIYSYYKSENNAPITMRQLVKNVEIPAEIDYAYVSAEGDCSASPYIIFGKCSGMNQATVNDTSAYVHDNVASLLSGYFRGGDSSWNAKGTEMFNIIKSGFASYAADKKFIYNDYSKVASVTNNLKNSPYNTSN